MAPTATYLQRGEALDYRNTTEETIPHGTVVTIGTRIGVTGCEIPPGKLGSLHVCGVFRIKKPDAAAMEQGQTAYFDGTGITGTSGDNAIEVGYAAEAADAAAETVLVKLNG